MGHAQPERSPARCFANPVKHQTVEVSTVSCLLCPSDNQAEFAAEMIIHFSGRKNIDNPGVRAFSKLLVCLDCGFSRVIVPETELAILANGASASGTAIQRCLERISL